MKYSCTSQIKVIKEDGIIKVEWQKVHYGHSFNAQRIKLTKLQKVKKTTVASKNLNEVAPVK